MLQARVERRFDSGLSFVANYVFSKLIEKRRYLNDALPDLEKRIAAEDRPWRIVFSANYELPFGKGKWLASNANKFTQGLIGGWTADDIYTAQPSAPLEWGNSIYRGGDLQADPRNIDRVFDTTRFVTRTADQLEYNLRTFPTRFANLHTDKVSNLDAR